MELKFEVYTKIKKPIQETFDAVYNPKKLSRYFTTGEANAFPGAFAIIVKKVIKNEQIIFEWNSSAGDYKITVQFTFKAIDENSSMVSVSEFGWPIINELTIDEMNSHSSGWKQMLSCMKVFLENSKNVTEFFF